MHLTYRLATAATVLILGTTAGRAGTFTISPWTGDADSGITTTKTYTTAVDFNGDGTRVINGVPFTDTSRGSSSYQLVAANGFPPNPTNTNNLTGTSNQVVSDFFYSDGSGNANLSLGNLVPGQTYTTTWYNVGFGTTSRQVNITPGDTGVPFLYDENQPGAGNGSILSYTFVAKTTQITYSFDAVNNPDSFHHYALTNSGVKNVAGSLPTATATYVSQSGAAPFTPTFQPLNNDLLQTKLLSAVGSGGDFAQEGSGGVPILNNGQFTINNSQLATGANGSSVVFTLDLTGAAAGC